MKRYRKIFIAAAILIAAALILFYFNIDPASSHWAPKCLFHELTGWQCPGCGAQRAVHAILHGRWAEAWSLNPFFLIIVPVAICLGIIEAFRRRVPRLYRTVYRPFTFILILLALTGWTIFRNL